MFPSQMSLTVANHYSAYYVLPTRIVTSQPNHDNRFIHTVSLIMRCVASLSFIWLTSVNAQILLQ